MPETHDALTHGCYVVTTVLNGRRYGMTCSWAMQIDSDKVLLILGSQSATGKAIRQSKVLGVSVLSVSQKPLALHFGGAHSDEADKFADAHIETGKTGVPLIAGALKTLECELLDDPAHTGSSCFVGRILEFHASGKRDMPLLLWHVDADP